MSISKIKVGSTEHDLQASKLTTARTIALSGDVSGSTTFDGSGNVTITTAVADDSHNHVISNVDGLQDALNNKLEKAGYEYNKTLALGSTGYVCIGKFPCYDSNISVEIKSTTNTTYNGTLVIATQNINTSLGGYYKAVVYGDENKTLTDKIKISYLTGSNVFSVYINLPPWSKNILHIQCVDLAGSPTDIATTITEIPSTATIVPTNAFTHKHSVTAAGTNSSTSITPAGTVSQPTFTGTAASHNHTFTGTAAEHTHTFTGTQATASVKYTPAGTVSSSFTGTAHNHTFSGTPATSEKPDTTNVTTIYSITGVGTLPSASLSSGTLPSCSYTAPSHSYTAPSLTCSVSNQCLTLTFNAGSHSFNAGSHSFSAGAFPTLTFSAGTLPTREAVSVPNTNHTHSVTATGTIGNTTAGGSVSSTFSGTEATISHTFTPAGSISKTSVTPAGTISSKELTPAGTVSKPTFTGTAASHTHTFTGSAVNSATES